jgi:hypothetical protein
MDRTKAEQWVRRLWPLANSRTAEEAAYAAERIQRLIDEHDLDLALSDLEAQDREGGTTRTEYTPEDMTEQVVFTFGGSRASTWMLSLSATVSDLNGCKGWYDGGTRPVAVHAAGREEDLARVALLLDHFHTAIQRLARAALRARTSRESGRTFGNSFRIGAVRSIRERMTKASREAREEALDPELAYRRARERGDAERLCQLDARQARGALVKVEQALAVLDTRWLAAEQYAMMRYPLRPRPRSRTSFSRQGYEAGREAGRQVDLDPPGRVPGGSG